MEINSPAALNPLQKQVPTNYQTPTSLGFSLARPAVWLFWFHILWWKVRVPHNQIWIRSCFKNRSASRKRLARVDDGVGLSPCGRNANLPVPFVMNGRRWWSSEGCVLSSAHIISLPPRVGLFHHTVCPVPPAVDALKAHLMTSIMELLMLEPLGLTL